MLTTVVHVTHEVVQKIGGIGAVLQGLLTAPTYAAAVPRNILVGPLFSADGPAADRLGSGGEVLYSSLDGRTDHPQSPQLAAVERRYNVHIVYGRKVFTDPFTGASCRPEALLIQVHQYDKARIDLFKWRLFERFGIASNQYEWIWDYEQYCRIAEPAIDALLALGCGDETNPAVLLAHEYMGMPTALAAMLNAPTRFRTIFHAHETAPVRRLVESHPGHDITFYNALTLAQPRNLTIHDVFGSQKSFYKYPLVEAAKFCDNIFAVGDLVAEELRFLDHAFSPHPIDLAYNGVPAARISLNEKLLSRRRLRRYSLDLLGYEPDFIFTHVTRLVLSKGLWRDIRVMEQLDPLLRSSGQTAVLLVLSTETSPRPAAAIQSMESAYHWPVAHREGYPDLTGGEAAYYTGVQEFNARARQSRIIFINQFGFDAQACGSRVPPNMNFTDLRHGSDVEFGQSIYEPFGIAQLEPLAFGALCVLTRQCGCAGFVRRLIGASASANILEVDYTPLPAPQNTLETLLALDASARVQIETNVAAAVAAEIYRRLPRTERQVAALLDTGYSLASRMSWDAVARDYVLPGITRALQRR